MGVIRVALADDHVIMRDGIRALLKGCDDIEIVGEASDGNEAIDIAERELPDLFIMDISMVEMNGLEAGRRIKKINPNIKLLVLSQYDNKEYIISAIKSGVDGFLPKSAMGETLITAIRSLAKGESFLYHSAAQVMMRDYVDRMREEPLDRLTVREKEVLGMVCEGYTSRDISERLGISIKTVQGHRTRIMEKLDMHNQAEVIKYAIQKGLVNINT